MDAKSKELTVTDIRRLIDVLEDISRRDIDKALEALSMVLTAVIVAEIAPEERSEKVMDFASVVLRGLDTYPK